MFFRFISNAIDRIMLILGNFRSGWINGVLCEITFLHNVHESFSLSNTLEPLQTTWNTGIQLKQNALFAHVNRINKLRPICKIEHLKMFDLKAVSTKYNNLENEIKTKEKPRPLSRYIKETISCQKSIWFAHFAENRSKLQVKCNNHHN